MVADNCSDDTAEIARTAGVDVVVRHDPERRGKGYALEFGVRQLRLNPPDVDLEAWQASLDLVAAWKPSLLALTHFGTYDVPVVMAADRERDRKLTAAGWIVVRFTRRQLRDDPGGVLQRLRALLAAAAA